MKKFLCIILSLLLVFNTTIVYADEHGGSSGVIPTPTPPYYISPDELDEYGRLKPPALLTFLDKLMTAAFAGEASTELGSLLYSFLLDYDNSDNSISLEDGGSTVHLHERFINEFNQKVQDKVHALDGYYIVEPQGKYSPIANAERCNLDSVTTSSFLDYIDGYTSILSSYCNWILTSDILLYFDGTDTYHYLQAYSISKKNYHVPLKGYWLQNGKFSKYSSSTNSPIGDTGGSDKSVILNTIANKSYTYGDPFKVFYSVTTLKNYIDKGRTYAPKLPNVTIKIPVKYINNSVSLPDITYNITTENKTEIEIQNQYDTTIKNYLDSLDDFSDGSTTTPTPTPSGGFTDGTTPTPTPAIGDGGDDSGNGKVDLSEITDLLKKILDKLTSFADSHSKFEKTITDYLETNDKKLDQIIDAIDKLSQGKEDGEDYKCKYDYTELSDYLKKLWNDSDKKFDTMIDLLEENNEYQKKLVDTLDSIKSILIKQSIMDSFKDRSKKTADKAKEKFPTSVPWDIAIVINAMSAEPEKPKFNLPIKIASLNIDENIEVDLSSGEWEKLAKTCRYMLSLLFVLFMVQLSRRLFFNKGDDD